jgi:hypothetical protein
MSSISDALDVFSRLNWPRAFAALLIIVVFAFSASLYEAYTHSLRIDRAENALSLAARAEEYRKSRGDTPSPQQIDIYSDAMYEARAAAMEPDLSSTFTAHQLKFLCAFLPWLLMALVYVGGSDSGRFIGMFGAVIIGLLVASGLSVLPFVGWPIGNLLLLPAAAWLVVVGAFALVSRRKSNKTMEPTR